VYHRLSIYPFPLKFADEALILDKANWVETASKAYAMTIKYN
jgi:hypothetical protein